MAEYSNTLRKLETYPEYSELLSSSQKVTRNGLSSDIFLFKEARYILSHCQKAKEFEALSEEDQETAMAVIMWYYLICFYILGILLETSENRGKYLRILGRKFKIKPYSQTNDAAVYSDMNRGSGINILNTRFIVKLKPYGQSGVIFLGILPIDSQETLLNYAIDYAKNYDTLEYVDLKGISGTALVCADANNISSSKGYGYSSSMNPVWAKFTSLYDLCFDWLESHIK